ncbi:nucleotidyl transferase AbiEii/AbiGii toxin family protein [Belliella pelovolcani]|uniref:Nucleotidyl transferase AbiEii toxin, Type IV TA system n=1 Tax=Belliella pelovolcani TaxID=529505 RepID=A0A1N7MEX8_9BACT|nr:nucleotidyl transferase AbiEii/AbiGii toxin family protein [Belliella pelovolcani]SIS84643.1 Nucleotidyl transferase AbiEii toxin, Type IV TA system [Belliella pelovolcani]
MLHTETVQPALLELLSKIMTDPLFNEFRLVGGTSLALQIGHRQSIDIDLFGDQELEEYEISDFLSQLGKIQVLKKSKNILIYSVNGIKVDFVNYKYPWLTSVISENEFRLASKEDIGAMKLNAIAGRGSKKDFIDLYFLLNEFSLEELIGFYRDKYQDGSEFLVLKSLSYFADADTEPTPLMLKDANWDKIKNQIANSTKNYMK